MEVKRLILIIKLLINSLLPFAQNTQLLDSTEAELYTKLKIFQWEKSVNPEQLKIIDRGLSSTKDMLVTEALKVVAVHNLQNNFLDQLKEGLGPKKGFSPIIKEIILHSKGSSKSLERRLIQLQNDSSGFNGIYSGKIKEKIADILVVRKVRCIRNSEESDITIAKNYLSEYNNLLLQYSTLPPNKAIRDLIDKVTVTKIVSSTEYNLVEVLNTYGEKALNEVVRYISNSDSLKNTTPYGRLLLITHIDNCYYLLSKENKTSMANLFSKEDIRSKFFENLVSLRVQSTLLENKLK